MHSAYEVIKQERIEDIRADGTLLRHKKSGARVLLLACEDENKVFTIGFRTPPKDSTGVAHIIEHTVLCGSEKYPLKDPFVELLKSSLCTFLNAITYPDRTMYPVASCNAKDFQNLMSVYMDAVLKPNIYHTKNFFLQEGWHYHLEKAEDPLTVSGVVYNEMKGALSQPDDVISEELHRTLYPDTPYGVNSGGDPEHIPDLTYEDFLAFHRAYYHPANSYICLYGDMDMEEKLDWLDAEYLSGYDRIQIDSEIRVQKAFDAPVERDITYPILDDEPLEENSYLVEGFCVGDYKDVELQMAFDVLSYVLLAAPGAPIRQALLDAGIGKEISGDYTDSLRQPFFAVMAQNTEADKKEAFLATIHDTLQEIAEKGLDPMALASGINFYEFRFREADYGSPKGLAYILDAMSSWLYDEDMPFDRLHRLAVFEKLKGHAAAGDGYFEDLIRRYLLDNPHRVIITARPERGLAAKREEALAEKLAAHKAALSETEVADLVRATKELRLFQEEGESEEALAKLPTLDRSDLDPRTPVKLCTDRLACGEIPLLHQKYETNGIAYLNLLFDASSVPDELTWALGLLKDVLGYVSTENYSYGELFHVINARSGGIRNVLQTYPLPEEGAFAKIFMIQTKYLYEEQDFVFSMLREILGSSDLTDTKRLREIVDGRKAKLQYSLPSQGNAVSRVRASSYFSAAAGWRERTSGIAHYRALEGLQENFDDSAAELTEQLQRLMKILFRPENLTVSITAAEGRAADLPGQISKLTAVLCTDPVERGGFAWEPEQKNEAFVTSGQVQYVAAAGNFRTAGFEFHGAMNVMRLILNLDYLWTEIRVKGGAYGMGALFDRQGLAAFSSYRDPHLARTLDVYRALPDYLQRFQADERDMTKYIIGTIGAMDEPLSAAAKGEVALAAHYTGRTEEDFQRERDELLSADVEVIRSFAPAVRAALDQGNICVIGSETEIDKHRGLFAGVEPLNRG